MSSLYKKENKINYNFDDKKWIDIINIIYNKKNKQFKFQLNSELIDIENRFRIVNYKKIKYIIKRTSKEKAILELENSKKLYNIMINYSSKKFKIIPIIPKLEILGENAYLISEYKGHTLQEKLYTEDKTFLSFIDFTKILNYMFENKVIYRGFIPRNTIIKNNIIYLIDFEDIIFAKVNKPTININFYINIILNWQYFYKMEEINNFFEQKNIVFKKEENLNNYEVYFKKLINFSGNEKKLKEKIKKIVVFSEKPIKSKYNLKREFIVMPTDLTHLFSDLTNAEYDAFFDIINYIVRKNDEELYIYYLKIFSRIIYLLNDNIENLRLYIIVVFILYLENIIDKNNKIIFRKNFSINNFNKLIYTNYSIANLVLTKDIVNLKDRYLQLLKKCFSTILKNDSDNLLNSMNLFLVNLLKNLKCGDKND